MTASHPTRVVLGQLLPVLPHLLRWRPLLVAAVTAGALFAWKYGAIESTDGAVWLFRFLALLLVVGAVFLLDDASGNVTAPSPTPLRVRTGVRLGSVGLSLAGGCALAFVAVDTAASLAHQAAGLTVEVASLAAVACASSLALARWLGIPEPGQLAGLFAVGTMVAAHLANGRWPMLVGPGPEWEAAHLRWLGVLAVAVLVIIGCLRDPAARRRRLGLVRD